MSPDARAQSETIGVVILVGVFAITATIVGVAIIGSVTDDTSDAPLVDLNASATADNVTLVHAGGDPLPADEVSVVLQQDGSDQRIPLSAFTELSGTDPSSFDPGERWRHGNPYDGGTLRVLVVHDPSSEVVYEDTVDVR